MIRRAIHLQLIVSVAAAANVATTKTIGDVMNEVSHVNSYLPTSPSNISLYQHTHSLSTYLQYRNKTATTWIVRPEEPEIKR
jgi:hypothetical protein